MDWIAQTHSIATLSKDSSMRIFSSHGDVLAESLPDEQSAYALTKVRALRFKTNSIVVF